MRELRPRVVYPMRRAPAAVVLYTDAEWTALKRFGPWHPWYCLTHTTGMGALAFNGTQRLACCGEASAEVVNSLKTRETQITALELLAVAGALCTFAASLAGRDLILFCDNQSVCAALAKGASRALDLQLFTTAVHGFCHRWHINLWVEWVPTKENPADELSRAGTSKWDSPTLIIPKKDGRICWVSNLRELNKVVVHNQYPLPIINDILHKHNG